MKKWLYLLSLLWIVSCGTHHDTLGLYSESEVASDILEETAPLATPAAGRAGEIIPDPAQAAVVNKKKIIRDGRMGIQTDNLTKTKSEIDALVVKYGGYYAGENYDDNDLESLFDWVIRIPEGYYEKFVSEIESGNSKVTYKAIQARDVTEQFFDLEVRLGNKRTYLQRYRELVKQARNIEEILQVEQYVRSLEEEIESAEGRLRFLSDQVAYSTLNLQLSQPKPYKFTSANHAGFWEKLKSSVVTGWRVIVEVFLFLMKLWPFWIIGGGIAWFILRQERKKREQKKV